VLRRSPYVGAQKLTVAIDLSQGSPGTRVTGTGTIGTNPAGVFIGKPGDTIEVSWDDTGGTILANTIVKSDGTFTASFNIPSNATAGAHTIYFMDRGVGTGYVLGSPTFTVRMRKGGGNEAVHGLRPFSTTI
jgi:hypothetical protein